MTSLEFIEKEIEYKNENIKHWENQLERYPNSDVFIRCIEVRKEQLQTLQSIKAKLEAWEVVKKFIIDSNGVYLLRLDSDDGYDNEYYQILKKALEEMKDDK